MFSGLAGGRGERTRYKAVEGKGCTIVGLVSPAEIFGIHSGGSGKHGMVLKQDNGAVHMHATLGRGTWVWDGQMEGRQAKGGLRAYT